MLFPRWIWFLFLELCVLRAVRGMTISKVVYSHAGMCPNEMNPNLWVDAMSTCMRECESDQVSACRSRALRSLHFLFIYRGVFHFCHLSLNVKATYFMPLEGN